MFEDIENIDWQSLGIPSFPQSIQKLLSHSSSERETAFDDLKYTDVYEKPKLASVIVPFVLEIIEQDDTPADTELLLTFITYLRSYLHWYVEQGYELEYSTRTIQLIDKKKPRYEHLATLEATGDAAKELLQEIKAKSVFVKRNLTS